MAKAVTLKNNNGDELYPTTMAELVNGTLASSQIENGAVDESKIDWTNINYERTANGFTVKNNAKIAGWNIYIYTEMSGANTTAGSIVISATGGNTYFMRDTSAGSSTANIGEFFSGSSSNVIPFLRGANSNLAGPIEIFLQIRKSGSTSTFFDIRCDSVLLTTSNGLKSEIQGRMGIPTAANIDADFTITLSKGASTFSQFKAVVSPIILN